MKETNENYKMMGINKDGIIVDAIVNNDGEVLEEKEVSRLSIEDLIIFKNKFPFYFSKPIPVTQFKLVGKLKLPTQEELITINLIEKYIGK